MNKTAANHFTRAFGKAMLAAALLMPPLNIMEQLKRRLSTPVSQAQNIHKIEKPLRGNLLCFPLKHYIKQTEQNK